MGRLGRQRGGAPLPLRVQFARLDLDPAEEMTIAMAPSLTETLHDWRDFYLLVGTASATLVGLMFVASSMGASVFNEKYLGPLRAFITPTVARLASPLFASVILTMPDHTALSLADCSASAASRASSIALWSSASSCGVSPRRSIGKTAFYAMPPSLTETLHDWRDFYLLVGTASATLVGLMFVASSIDASVFNEKYLGPLRAFITPTVAHLASPLFASIILTMPATPP